MVELKRTLSLWQVTFMSAGIILDTGIYIIFSVILVVRGVVVDSILNLKYK